MPAIQQGQPYRLAPNRWGLRYYDRTGVRRRTKEKFTSPSAARQHFRDVIEPQLRGEEPPKPELTFSQFVKLYLERHKANVRPRTIATLTERLRHAESTFGDFTLREMQGMTDEVAAWRARQPGGVRYGRTQALRQVLGAAVRWGYTTRNPAVDAGKNPQPEPRPIRVFGRDELDRIASELPPQYAPIPTLAAATGLRPEEWMALEGRDIDRPAGVLYVRRTVSDGQVVALGKTSRSRRQVPLSPRALAALDALPPRSDTRLFSAPEGGLLDLDNWRARYWSPAVDAAGVDTPARIYDLRSTFASNALAAGLSGFELAKVMGTSQDMIERHYGSLLDGAAAGIASRLAEQEALAEKELVLA